MRPLPWHSRVLELRKEIKLAMREGARVNYSWTTDRGVVNYDTHGDPIDAPREFYHGYGKATGVASDEGVQSCARCSQRVEAFGRSGLNGQLAAKTPGL